MVHTGVNGFGIIAICLTSYKNRSQLGRNHLAELMEWLYDWTGRFTCRLYARAILSKFRPPSKHSIPPSATVNPDALIPIVDKMAY